MAKAPFLEIKVRPTAEQKRLFQKAAEAMKPLPMSLNQWLLVAGLEKAIREGITLEEKKGR